MNILLIGDVVGKVGRKAVACLLPEIRRTHDLDIVIANGENAAGGKGLTPSTADELFEAGVEIITSGNHIWRYNEIYSYLDSEAPVLRPLNYPKGAPGRGFLCHNGVAVINLMGRTFMPGALDCPFRGADDALANINDCAIVIVDMHAEATSEKAAMAWYLNGRVSAVIGSHTHIPTADARVLPKGTAFVTDVGMVGSRDSILGVMKEPVIDGFLNQLPARFTTDEHGPVVFNSVLIQVDDTSGRATGIQRVDHEVS
ncbi:MAG: YmdB family metallophosphoesterase [Chloroflexi bacterium]|nr:YmdB family metallophosphoesterase [Chloroflexota bacterium]